MRNDIAVLALVLIRPLLGWISLIGSGNPEALLGITFGVGPHVTLRFADFVDPILREAPLEATRLCRSKP